MEYAELEEILKSMREGANCEITIKLYVRQDNLEDTTKLSDEIVENIKASYHDVVSITTSVNKL